MKITIGRLRKIISESLADYTFAQVARKSGLEYILKQPKFSRFAEEPWDGFSIEKLPGGKTYLVPPDGRKIEIATDEYARFLGHISSEDRKRSEPDADEQIAVIGMAGVMVYDESDRHHHTYFRIERDFDAAINALEDMGDFCARAKGPLAFGKYGENKIGFALSADDVEFDLEFTEDPADMSQKFYAAAEWLAENDDGSIMARFF
jgi:hypothetical protein